MYFDFVRKYYLDMETAKAASLPTSLVESRKKMISKNYPTQQYYEFIKFIESTFLASLNLEMVIFRLTETCRRLSFWSVEQRGGGRNGDVSSLQLRLVFSSLVRPEIEGRTWFSTPEVRGQDAGLLSKRRCGELEILVHGLPWFWIRALLGGITFIGKVPLILADTVFYLV